MKIAFFVPHITRPAGFENNVSAHVQIPCEIARRLLLRGHQVDLFTDSLVEGYCLPVCLPGGMNVMPLVNRSFIARPLKKTISKYSLFFSFISMVWQLKKKLKGGKYDVIHFFGTERMLVLSKLLSICGCRTSQVMTFNQFINAPLYGIIRRLNFFWQQFDSVVVSMECMRNLVPRGIDVQVMRHGIVKRFSLDDVGTPRSRSPFRVLFWQTPAYITGFDICVQLFRSLAPSYPDIHFDLAVRSETDLADLESYEKEIKNGHVYRFPYPDGVTVEKLLAESVCVFQPFREYTYHPQLVILESLLLGIPVVASSLPGACELIKNGENGFLFQLARLDVAEKEMRLILDNREIYDRMAVNNRRLSAEWTWEGYEDRLLTLYAGTK